MSLVGANSIKGGAGVLAVMGLLGAALIYGDGVITPAISVLSAVEGLNVATTALKPYVMPIAVAILLLLFATQRFGTDKIGRAFGPIMMVWFIVIALLGLFGIVRHPGVLAAVNPLHAMTFLSHSGGGGFLVLGGVFLCITGGEALYADMGHFGKGPIRLSWYAIVLPALLLSYAGQTALLMEKGSVQGNPFFQLAPAWSIYPLVGLATLATVIASQAIITGSFSMTRQAVQLGWLPGFRIQQTSDKVYGQIYIPVINWLMMGATIGITMAFGSSDKLAGAYGTAVSTTMLLTTLLLFTAMRKVWKWGLFLSAAIAGIFLVVDIAFFTANLLKIADGGWVPLTFGAVIFSLMICWRSGVDAVHACIDNRAVSPEAFIEELKAAKIPRVPGTAVFLTRMSDQIPPLMVDHVQNMGALQETVVALSLHFDEAPRIDEAERASVAPLGAGLWRIVIRFGFVEIPDVAAVLGSLKELDSSVSLSEAIYFGTRDHILRRPHGSWVAHWSAPVFAFLYRNAANVVDRFYFPPENTIEIARQIEI
jgi:KUP system potassium uptake protein